MQATFVDEAMSVKHARDYGHVHLSEVRTWKRSLFSVVRASHCKILPLGVQFEDSFSFRFLQFFLKQQKCVFNLVVIVTVVASHVYCPGKRSHVELLIVIMMCRWPHWRTSSRTKIFSSFTSQLAMRHM